MKPTSLLLTALAVTGALVACSDDDPYLNRPIDPCVPQYYNEMACQQAVNARGYYYAGTFYPHVYAQPFFFYSNSYHTYTSHGGTVRSAPSTYYSRSYSGSSVRSSTGRSGFGGSVSSPSGTSRGGFGGIGSARGSSGGGFGG